jgi:hypothetical protein
MPSIVDDAANGAEWIAKALSSSGYRADFSPGSLWEIERFFDEHSAEGQATPGGLLAEDLGSRIFALGSYIGEVVRRVRGGTWSNDDDDAEAEINVSLVLPDKTRAWPVQRAMKRFRNGPEDSVVAWGTGLGVTPGPKPPPPRRGFLRRLLGR